LGCGQWRGVSVRKNPSVSLIRTHRCFGWFLGTRVEKKQLLCNGGPARPLLSCYIMGKGKNKGKQMANDKVEVEKEISVTEVEIKEVVKVTKDSEKSDEPTNMATDQVADEEKTGGEKNEENKDENVNKGEKKSGKAKKKKSKKNKKLQTQDDKKPKTTGGTKDDLAGLIFMCNSKTKQDCFRYRVFGLPKSNKELVEKVTNGMRLFLYDFDLRLMYGIYKAAGSGGYDLEPEAFKSTKKPFPAQVRFRIQKECLPLSEEKFKVAIKDNYYGKKKFKFELNAEQVKNLVQLFKPVPAQNSRGPRDSRPGRPARVAREPRRVPFVDQVPQVPLYRPDTVLPQRAPYVDAYALQASDPYASVYQRQALPPSDPLPVRNGLVSDFDYRGVDPGLEYLHRQRIREQIYLDEINRTYVPREADYGEAALRRADFTSPPGRSYSSLIGSSSLYRY